MTPSQLLAINHEDLTIHQQNLPGGAWRYPNWGRKMRFTIECAIPKRGYTVISAIDRALRPQESALLTWCRELLFVRHRYRRS